jgi:hypothetical protein
MEDASAIGPDHDVHNANARAPPLSSLFLPTFCDDWTAILHPSPTISRPNHPANPWVEPPLLPASPRISSGFL